MCSTNVILFLFTMNDMREKKISKISPHFNRTNFLVCYCSQILSSILFTICSFSFIAHNVQPVRLVIINLLILPNIRLIFQLSQTKKLLQIYFRVTQSTIFPIRRLYVKRMVLNILGKVIVYNFLWRISPTE